MHHISLPLLFVQKSMFFQHIFEYLYRLDLLSNLEDLVHIIEHFVTKFDRQFLRLILLYPERENNYHFFELYGRIVQQELTSQTRAIFENMGKIGNIYTT
ncbi:MAG: hypothetical protein A3K30_03260 [Deltaproteobacteria bacterium RBG_13_51_10]|nr:MAG: hypothetical protein A3K30_03260 [Deltaproteobacteria bacterium RBG_13_51_10]